MAESCVDEFIELTEGRDFSRILYTNPVCFLISQRPDHGHNVMILSWLSPINNKGLFSFSLNKKRYTNTCLRNCSDFILCIPTKDMQELVLSVGKCSGRVGNKIDNLSSKGLNLVPLLDSITPELKNHEKNNDSSFNMFSGFVDDGEEDDEEDKERQQQAEEGEGEEYLQSQEILEKKIVINSSPPSQLQPMKIDGTIAWLRVSIKSWNEADDEHSLIMAQIVQGAVHSNYWNGKHFIPKSSLFPPYLTFLGSQIFAYTIPSEYKHVVDDDLLHNREEGQEIMKRQRQIFQEAGARKGNGKGKGRRKKN